MHLPLQSRLKAFGGSIHLVKGDVVYVYWMDTVYVQNTLPTE